MTRIHTYRTKTTWRRRTTAASVRYAWGGWGRITLRGRSERGTSDRAGSFRMRKTNKRLMLRTLHLTTFGGSSVQFLFIFCMPRMKEGSELIVSSPQKYRLRMDGRVKVGVHKDSNIRMLTGTIKADWIQLPVVFFLSSCRARSRL